MEDGPKDVFIDGVRYVPAADLREPTLDELREALLLTWWTPELLAMPKYADAASETYISLTTEKEDGDLSVEDFLTELKLKLSVPKETP